MSGPNRFPLPGERVERYTPGPWIQAPIVLNKADEDWLYMAYDQPRFFPAGRSSVSELLNPVLGTDGTNGWVWGDTLTVFSSDCKSASASSTSVSNLCPSESVRLFRDGREIAADDYRVDYPAPTQPTRYRVLTRNGGSAWHPFSTRSEASWDFTATARKPGVPSDIPLLAVRYTPAVDLYNTAPAGGVFRLPFVVGYGEGFAAQPLPKVTSLRIEVSYDDGRTWRVARVVGGAGNRWTAHLRHPATAGYVSLRATVGTAKGEATSQTVIRGYGLK